MTVLNGSFTRRSGLSAFLAAAIAATAGLAHAGPSPHMYGGSFGLAGDQTARVNIASIDNPNILEGSTRLPPDPCMVELKVFDADGSVVVQTVPRSVRTGATLSHDVRFIDLRGTRAIDPANPNRAQLRVASYLARASGKSGCPSDTGALRLSVEVVDNATGGTVFMVPTDFFVPAVQ